MKKIELKGKKFGNLTVIEESIIKKRNLVSWNCVCDCGKKTIVTSHDLAYGNTISCGCKSSRNKIGELNKSHGMRRTRQYNIWTLMIRRCNNSKSQDYHNYGGRGIKVVWKSFAEFWDDMKDTYSKELTIDRIDNNGNYCKDNCRWITRAEQNQNKRGLKMITYKGETLPRKTMCDKYNKKYQTIAWRMDKSGLTFDEAITK